MRGFMFIRAAGDGRTDGYNWQSPITLTARTVMHPLAQLFEAQNILSHVQGLHCISIRTGRASSSSARIHDEHVAR